MPPHASLSSHDGRTSSSSARGRQQSYYSNEDIQLLHDVVVYGEEILPQLPERDRLPTNALFRAADIILPRRGIDPDDEKLSPLLFKIGGRHQPDGLLDRFAAVLDDIGIELEYVPQHEPEGFPVARIPAVRSPAPSSSASTLHSGTFPLSPRFNGRRRRNSDSTAQVVLNSPQAGATPRRRRSVSVMEDPRPSIDLFKNSEPVQHIDPWLAQIPSYAQNDDRDDASHTREEANGGGDTRDISLDQDPLGDRHVHHDQEGSTRREHAVLDGTTGSGFSNASTVDDSLPDYLRRRNTARDALLAAAASRAPLPNGQSSALNGYPAEHGCREPFQSHPRHSAHDFPDYLRKAPSSPSPETQSDISRPYEASASVSASVRSEAPLPRTPLSPYSGLGWDSRRGDSDTTAQDDLEGPPPKVDPTVMAKMADAFYLQCSLIRGSAAIQAAKTLNSRRRTLALGLDQGLTTSDSLVRWSRQAGTVVRSRHDAAQRPDDVSPKGGYLHEYRKKMMRRAGRAYDLSIMHRAFTHWHVTAQDEAERTDIARRHLLRKKFFGAWCQQNARDGERVNVFTLRTAMQQWSRAAAHNKCLDQGATRQYDDAILQEAVYRWVTGFVKLEVRLKTVADDKVRSKMVENIGVWRVETSRQLDMSHRSDMDNIRDTCGRAIQDWQRQAALERGLRELLARREATVISMAVHAWRHETALLQERSEQVRVDVLGGWAAHWRNETRLSWHKQLQEKDLKTEVAYQWLLEERAKVVHRHHERKRKQSAARRLLEALREARSRESQLREKALELEKQNVWSDFVGAANEQRQEYESQRQTAEAISSSDLAVSAVMALSEGLATLEEMEELSHRGAYYVSTSNALSGWAEYARQRREDRLKSTYHRFRRTLKKATASECLSTWIAAADLSMAKGWEADAVRAENNKGDVIDSMNYWIAETNDKLVKQSIAVEGDMELYLNRWRLQSDNYEAGAAEASDLDAYSRMRDSWDAWELQSMQFRGRQHTAAELCEKNNRRLCRQVTNAWRESALPEEEPDDFHSSYASRHGARRGAGSWRPAYSGSSTPLGPMSAFDEDQPGPPRLGSSPLQPITEYDERQSPTLRFRSPRASQLFAYEERTTPAAEQPFVPSQSAPVYHSNRLALPQRFRRAYHHPPSTPALDFPSTLPSSPPAPSAPAPLFPDGPGQPAEPVDPEPPRPRFGSLQRKLDQASRLAASVQLQPPSTTTSSSSDGGDFPGGNGPTRAHTYSGRMRRPLAADTPTRWTGSGPAGPVSVGSRAATATTTPRAPLPSAREEQLRYEYSSRGILLNPTGGRASTRQAARVAFTGVGGDERLGGEESGEQGGGVGE